MKIRDGFMVRPVAGSYVVVPVGSATVDFNGIMTLNETGYFLWQQLEKGADKEDLLKNMLSEYVVDAATATKDIERFLKQLEDANLAN